MAFTELEHKRCERDLERFMEQRRPPPHVRDQVDLVYRIRGQSIEIREVRPVWNDPSRTVAHGIAKATFVRTKNIWRLFWMRADLKWHAYPPHPEVRTLAQALELVAEDHMGCFFG